MWGSCPKEIVIILLEETTPVLCLLGLLACLLCLLGLLGLRACLFAWLACLPGLLGPFVALAVLGPGLPDRGQMEEEREDEEEKKRAGLGLKSNNPTLNGGE